MDIKVHSSTTFVLGLLRVLSDKQSTIKSILCLNVARASSALSTRWVAWVLGLKTHLFRGKILGFQRAYYIKRKTSLSINKTPTRQTIFAKTLCAEPNLNQQTWKLLTSRDAKCENTNDQWKTPQASPSPKGPPWKIEETFTSMFQLPKSLH